MGGEEESDAQAFTVEVILAAKVGYDEQEKPAKTKRGKKTKKPELRWYYQVKWAGYPVEESTWEPEGNLSGCEKLKASFWAAIGYDHEDYGPDDEPLVPPKKWIKAEKKKFAKEWEKTHPRETSLRPGPEASEHEDSDTFKGDKSKRKSSKSKGSGSKKRKKPVVQSLGSDSDSEPLAAKRRKVSSSVEPKKSQSQSTEPETSKQNKLSTPPLPRVPKRKPRRVESETPALTEPEPAPVPVIDSMSAPNLDSDVRGLFSDSPPPMPVEPPLPIRKSDRPPLPYRRPLPSSMKSMDTPAAGSVYKYNPLSLPSLDPRVVTAGQNADGAASNSVNKPLPITRRDSHARFAEKPTETPSTGIATKQRLANFALQPIAPKQVGTLSSAKTPTLSGFPSGHPAFSQSGFKKNLPPQETHTLASLNSAPDSPLHVPAENARDFSKPEFHRRHTHSNSTGSASMADADAFLQTLMPKTLAEPFSEIQMDVDEEPMPPLPQRGPPQKKLKAWTWTGLLLVKAGGQDVPREFSILIDEELELQRTGFKFSVLFGNVKNLCINSLYDVQDLPLLLRACKPPAYRARMSLQAESEDAVSNHWATFVQYMSKRKKVAAIALMLDEHVVAHLLLYPASSHVLPAEIPPVTLKGHTLVAVILPWSLTQGEIAADPRQGRTSATRDISLQTHIKPLAKGYQEIERGHLEASTPHWDNLVKTRHLFQLAIRVLGFPSKIYEFLKLTSRRWAVCSAKGNSRNRLDVQLLRTILNRIMQESRAAPGSSHQPKIKGITHTSDPTDAGILFLHASTLHDLDNLPFLPAILLASNYVRVYMFGTDPSFPNISGVREILPCGGIVTLTPGAILNHPLQTMRLLKEISEHPLWMAYVLPSVIGFVAEVCRAKSGSIQNFPIPFLLNAIASGNLASIQAPPPAKAWYGKTDQRPAWVRENLSGKSMTQLEALTRATATFHTKYANADPESWEARIKEEVVEDLKQMQRQPVLLEGYRRFVVLGDGRMENRGSVECVPADTFKFPDDPSPE